MSVDLHLCLSQGVSLFLDNIAEVNLQMSSNSIVCKKKKHFQIKQLQEKLT